MMQKNNLFTPIDGVVVELLKQENKAGIEIAGKLLQKNEGVIVSEKPLLSKDIFRTYQILTLNKGDKIKFTEGYDLGDNQFFVALKNIIGYVYKNKKKK